MNECRCRLLICGLLTEFDCSYNSSYKTELQTLLVHWQDMPNDGGCDLWLDFRLWMSRNKDKEVRFDDEYPDDICGEC